MTRPRDSQRARLYRWERATLPVVEVGEVGLLNTAYRTLTRGGVTVPVKILNVRRGCACRRFVHIPKNATNNPWYAVHEATHAILDYHFGNKLAWHGSEFVRAYIDALVDLLDYDQHELELSAAEAGLKVAK